MEKQYNTARYKTYLMHKPVGVVSCRGEDPRLSNRASKDSSDPLFDERVGGVGRPTVYDIAEMNGFPVDVGLVGRLDAETSGLILFSNDSDLACAIRDPVSEDSFLANSPYKSKEYLVELLTNKRRQSREEFSITDIESELSAPIRFSHRTVVYTTTSADVKVASIERRHELGYGRKDLGWVFTARIVLHEGKHHQIRRIAKRSSLKVLSLSRVRLAGILDISSLPIPGACRWLTDGELEILYTGLQVKRKPKWRNPKEEIDSESSELSVAII